MEYKKETLRLSNLCLNSIIDNLSWHNSLFISTEDENLKREFEFLQRHYSLDLLSWLEDCIPGECLDLLINKYLKVLHVLWFTQCPCTWERVASKIAEIGYTIEKISFDEVYVKQPWQDIICHLPNLKIFDYGYFALDDDILTNIAKFCPNIEEIKGNYRDSISFDGIKSLCEDENRKPLCSKLKKLFTGRTARMPERHVRYLLKNLPSLEVIDVRNLPNALYSSHRKHLTLLDKVNPYHITTLNIEKPSHFDFHYPDLLKVCLSVCLQVKSLTCELLEEEELLSLPKLPDLEELNIHCVSDSKINVNSLLKSQCGELTSLSARNCMLSIPVLYEHCPRIKNLILCEVDFLFDDYLKPVFTSLSSLTFEGSLTLTSVRAFSLFVSSPVNLRTLSIRRSSLLHSEMKADISKCCKRCPIEKISFFNTKIEEEFVVDLLVSCHTLSYLNICGCFNGNVECEILKFAEGLPNKLIVGNYSDFIMTERY